MTKTTAIVLLSIVTVIVLFLGVFSFIPDFEVGEYNEYHSPVGLIQKSNLLTDTVTANYLVELDDDVECFNAQNIIKARLRKAYGYYGVKVDYDEEKGTVTVEIPQTNNEAKSSAKDILSHVIANGKVEILSASYTSSPSYSEDSVVLSQEHFKRATVRSYINGETTLYICRVKLNSEGAKIAADELLTSTPYTCAVDGEVNTWVYYTGSELQITYAYSDVNQSKENAKVIASYINTDTLGATLTIDGKLVENTNSLAWIYLLVFGIIVLASLAFFAVRYKVLGIVPMIWQLCAVVIFTIFAGLVHVEIFNLAAAIGAILVYAFMTFFTVYVFERMRSAMLENKSFSWAKHTAFKDTMLVTLIAHGALLVLGIILWVIPSIVTTPLGCVFVYGAVLSFLVTFCLNRLFTLVIAPFYETSGKKAKSRK
ncbi:MAG: hypothetical protein J1F68_04975 [Clostridiales bacterium]|nr:hypothetical protein [Clostridiales bacterium]